MSNTAMAKLSDRQREILRILARQKQPVEWSQIWDSYTFADRADSLAMVNFGRVCDSLTRRGWVNLDDDSLVLITPTGRAVLEPAPSQS